MRALSITREQFINLKLVVTEFTDETVLLDGGQHGLFIGRWEIDEFVTGETDNFVATLTIHPTDKPKAEWLASGVIKEFDPDEITDTIYENGVGYYVLSKLSEGDCNDDEGIVTTSFEIKDVAFAGELAPA